MDTLSKEAPHPVNEMYAKRKKFVTLVKLSCLMYNHFLSFVLQLYLDHVSRKSAFEHAQNAHILMSYACVKYHTGFPFIYFIVFSESVTGQRRT